MSSMLVSGVAVAQAWKPEKPVGLWTWREQAVENLHVQLRALLTDLDLVKK